MDATGREWILKQRSESRDTSEVESLELRRTRAPDPAETGGGEHRDSCLMSPITVQHIGTSISVKSAFN
jgi:hypothetical protein